MLIITDSGRTNMNGLRQIVGASGMQRTSISRRGILKGAAALGLVAAAHALKPAAPWAGIAAHSSSPNVLTGDVIDLTISEQIFHVNGREARAVMMNGTLPGPLIRLKEGQQATLRVTNRLREVTSIHWHGLLVPPEMDGVPGVSFRGIDPGATFTYRFPIQQSGTYWFHSHSGGQELKGMYAPMIIDPIEPEPFQYERDYVVMLSDWTFESPHTVLSNLKKQAGYYNFQRRTAGEFLADVGRQGWWATVRNYLTWDQMRMDPTDFADVTAYTLTYLMNGESPESNWTGLFRPGERVRLRVINAAAMTLFDVRIPGLPMTVVQADGQPVQSVAVEEFRIGPAETYDVIVEPTADGPYTVFAETMDRSGYARGTLATRPGASAPLPDRRPRPLRTMAEMGMNHEGMSHGSTDAHTGNKHVPTGTIPSHRSPIQAHEQHGGDGDDMAADRAAAEDEAVDQRPSERSANKPVPHGPDDHGTGNQMVAEYSRNRMHEPGAGLDASERRVLLYTDLKSLRPSDSHRRPDREIEVHLTGHMERYMWSFDGQKYSEAPPIRFRYGERVRLTFVNDTMMEHPLHLHGMWMYLENGAGRYLPRKHTVLVKPAERLSVAIDADAPGRWAFHCHLQLHMEAGMFRVVEVSEPTTSS
jgi:CopA family copper-resistance protein